MQVLTGPALSGSARGDVPRVQMLGHSSAPPIPAPIGTALSGTGPSASSDKDPWMGLMPSRIISHLENLSSVT